MKTCIAAVQAKTKNVNEVVGRLTQLSSGVANNDGEEIHEPGLSKKIPKDEKYYEMKIDVARRCVRHSNLLSTPLVSVHLSSD